MREQGTAGCGSPIRVWFDLARAGNFPSVASNVLAALVLSSVDLARWPAPGGLTLAILGGWLVYAGGATFNDVADVGYDARLQPHRPIPRGAVTRGRAATMAGLELLVGIGLLIVAGASPLWSVALGVTILAYDWMHKRWIGSVILMAGCRVLLAISLASLPGHAGTRVFVGWVTALFVYIVVLSLVARWEYQPGAPAAMLGRSVGRLLAFIPLIDAGALLFAGAWLPGLACAAAIPLGRWAQRLAAAT